MDWQPACDPAGVPIDADRIARLCALLGEAGFGALVAQLLAEADRVLASARAGALTGAEPAARHADLHRLQGSCSALGLVETAARLASAGQQDDLAALGAVETALARALAEIAVAFPKVALHPTARSKR
jgi:hypothetical protein